MKISYPNFKQAKVLVVGDIMLDRYWHGGTSRISPEAPVPVVKVDNIEERPGGASNVALNVASLGAHARLIGLTGNDEASSALEEILSSARINCDFEKDENVATITKLRIISRNQQLIRLDFEDHQEDYANISLDNRVLQCLNEANLLVLSDYAKGAIKTPQPIIQAAKSAGIPVLVDPKGRDFSRYKGATLLTPNFHEFEMVAGECRDEKTIIQCARNLINQLDLEAMLVTRGEHGMTLIQKDDVEAHYFPAKAKEVYDVTGAGDSVIAVLASSLAAGTDLVKATAIANIAAGIVVGKLGTAAINRVELQRATQSDNEMGLGVSAEEQLAVAISSAKAGGEKIVMTNGCFDILHSGHVHYLNQARSLGDRLIVAVNDDDSVTRLKGPGRPINSVERRMAVLAGLGAVDWVVPFTEDTPQQIISKLLPDVLVKGGDYNVDEIAGGKVVIENGGEVKILDFVEGVSTTGVIETLISKQGRTL